MQLAEQCPQLSLDSKSSQGTLDHRETTQYLVVSEPCSRAANLLASKRKTAILIVSGKEYFSNG